MLNTHLIHYLKSKFKMDQLNNSPKDYQKFLNNKDEKHRLRIFIICFLIVGLIYSIAYSVEQRNKNNLLENKIKRDSLNDIHYKNLIP